MHGKFNVWSVPNGNIIMFIPNASAITILDDINVSYKNDNGIELAENEYEYVNEFYGESYFESTTFANIMKYSF